LEGTGFLEAWEPPLLRTKLEWIRRWRRSAIGIAERKDTNLPANPSKSDLDGLAKLIESIDNERVNTVRHIWHEETHEWIHERTAGPSSS